MVELYRHLVAILCIFRCQYCNWVFFFADTLVLEPKDPVVELPSETKVNLKVEVVTSSEASALYSVDVPKGSTLLEALILLKNKSVGFT